MSIDLKKALAVKQKPVTTSHDEKDVILYNLGIGTGLAPEDPTSPENLAYLFEDGLKVLPSYGVIPVFPMMDDTVMNTDGIDIDFTKVLHGEQEIIIHNPVPAKAELEHTAKIADIYDKGKAALIIVQVDSKIKGGKDICTNKFSVFARGEGGFGGERGPAAGNEAPDEMLADYTFETKTSKRMPLLYRLTGDMNPLHANPEAAKKAGFPKPILQGLCTFGVVCKAVIDNVLGGDSSQVTGYGVRFAGIFFPGDTLVTKVWKQKGKLIISTHSKEKESFVLTNAYMSIK
jgi:acyl dehydratase